MEEPSRVSPLEEHVGYWLRFVSNHVSQAFARKLADEDVSIAEWVVLRQLLSEAVPPSSLAERIGMTRGAVTKIVDRLADKGLALRETAEGDRRYQRLSLTDRGRSLVPRLAAMADGNDDEFFGHLDARRRHELIETMQEIVRRHGLDTVPTD